MIRPLIIALGLFLLSTQSVLAVIDIGQALKLGNTQDSASSYGDVGSFVGRILPATITIAGLILISTIVYAGFNYVSSAGDPEKTQKSKQLITGAIIGFTIVFASYWIVQLIESVTKYTIL